MILETWETLPGSKSFELEKPAEKVVPTASLQLWLSLNRFDLGGLNPTGGGERWAVPPGGRGGLTSFVP